MAAEFIDVSTDERGVATLRLNRPDKLNCFNLQMIEEWHHALVRLGADDTVRVIIVTGAGRAFCAGGDLDDVINVAGAGALANKLYFSEHIHKIPLTLDAIDKPVIAAINGAARGAGLDMALMCDLRLAAESASMAESYIDIGVMPGDGGTYFLPRLVGTARALELIWTGAVIDAAQAERIGLVNRVVADEDLQSASLDLARRIAEQPRHAVRFAKRAVYQGLTASLAMHLDMVSSHMAVLYETEDFRSRLEQLLARLKRRGPSQRPP